jgi:hypothetical protein
MVEIYKDPQIEKIDEQEYSPEFEMGGGVIFEEYRRGYSEEEPINPTEVRRFTEIYNALE